MISCSGIIAKMPQVQAKHTKITKLTAAGLAGVFLNPKCGSSDKNLALF